MAVNSLNSSHEGAFVRDIRTIINNNFSDVSLCDTQLDVTSSTTLTNVSGMVTGNLQAGTYKFRVLIPTVCTANNGSKFAFKQSVSSMLSSAQYSARMYTASGVPTVTNGTSTTDQALLADNTSGVIIFVEITGVVVVALEGTLQLQAAAHTSNSDTFSVFKYAQMQFERITIG